MKHFFLTLTLFLLTLLPASAVKKIEANPINIATVMVEKTDSAQIASTCEYYGYSYDGIVDGYTIMKHSNGSEIQFTFKDNETNLKYPIIVIKISETHKAIDTRLKQLDFEKLGNIYTLMRNIHSRYITQCKFVHKSTLIFRRIKNLSLRN